MQPGPHFLTPPKKNLKNYALLQRHKWVIFEPRSSEWFLNQDPHKTTDCQSCQ